MRICSFCGAENLDTAQLCASCGQSFPRSVTSEADTPSASETPITEAPATETPATETPATEAPTTETPVAEAPAVDAEVESSPPARMPSSDRTDFFERFAPERKRSEIYSLAVYLWFCAALNFFFGILSWINAEPLTDGAEIMPTIIAANFILSAFPSLLVATADLILGLCIRKFSQGAALFGIVYSAVGSVLFTALSVLNGGSARVIVGWITSLVLFIGAFRTIRALDRAWEKYQKDGIDPWGGPLERAKDQIHKQNAKRNRTVAIVCGAVIVVLAVIGILASESRYKTLNNGKWEDSVYTNEFFAFSYTLPDGWSRLTDAEQAAMNTEYYGSSNIKKSGGDLFSAFNSNSYDNASVYVYATVVRQESEDFGSLEMLQFWCDDNREHAEAEGIPYDRSEIGTTTVAGKSVMNVMEHFTYTEEGSSFASINEYVYTFLRQEGKYTFAITIYVYGSPLTDTALQQLLDDFTLLATVTSAP